MKNKLLVLTAFLLLSSFAISLVSAADIAYIVVTNSNVKQEFIDSMNNLELTYDIILAANAGTTNFSQYRAILLDNEYFPNWADIPINNVPALIVNGRNIANWGWATRVTTASQSMPIKVNVTCSHEICDGFSGLTQVYTSSTPNIYYLDQLDVYEGLTIIGSNSYDLRDAVIAAAPAGTTLTKSGRPSTNVSANTVFFGVTQSQYWTNETRQIFENSLMWVAGSSPLAQFEIPLSAGENLISLPLILDSTDASLILASNPEVTTIKTYQSGAVYSTSVMVNNKGYFLNSTANSVLVINGMVATEQQSVVLPSGMSLVGITSLSEISLSSLPAGIIEVSKRNADGSYSIATKYGTTWFNSFALQPGKGYWFKTNSEVTWNYTP